MVQTNHFLIHLMICFGGSTFELDCLHRYWWQDLHVLPQGRMMLLTHSVLRCHSVMPILDPYLSSSNQVHRVLQVHNVTLWYTMLSGESMRLQQTLLLMWKRFETFPCKLMQLLKAGSLIPFSFFKGSTVWLVFTALFHLKWTAPSALLLCSEA